MRVWSENVKAIDIRYIYSETMALWREKHQTRKAVEATEGWYEGHRMMLEAASEGANPSEGPLHRTFKAGNRDISIGSEYMRMQAIRAW